METGRVENILNSITAGEMDFVVAATLSAKAAFRAIVFGQYGSDLISRAKLS